MSKNLTKKTFALLFTFMLLLSPMFSVFSSIAHADENTETTNTEKLTESDSKSDDEGNSYENVSINTITESSELEEGDFEVSQGDGTVRSEEHRAERTSRGQ